MKLAVRVGLNSTFRNTNSSNQLEQTRRNSVPPDGLIDHYTVKYNGSRWSGGSSGSNESKNTLNVTSIGASMQSEMLCN